MNAGSFAKRIVLFILTNIAVLVLIGILANLFGVDRYLTKNGLNLTALLGYSAIVGFTGSFVSLALSKMMAKWSTGARVIEQPQNETEAWLVTTVHRLAQQSNIGMPEVAIYEGDEMNAFATGARRDNALVAVSTGLLRGMRRDEVEAVLAHEVAHVANGDMVTMTLIQGVLNTFVVFLSRIIGYAVDRFLSKDEEEGSTGMGYFIASMVAQIVLGIFASMIVMWFSRHREYRADAGAAKLVGATPMIAALERLRMQTAGEELPAAVNAFGISGKTEGFIRFFSSHPPLEDRIAALREGR
ncbi:protease HtpX [Myxococcota bacterium]|nr:protease HtpX [Myxococcota bacterium]